MTDDETPECRDAYRLERIEKDGTVAAIAVFYSAREALTLIPSLNEGYRLLLGGRQVWPNAASSGRQDGAAH